MQCKCWADFYLNQVRFRKRFISVFDTKNALSQVRIGTYCVEGVQKLGLILLFYDIQYFIFFRKTSREITRRFYEC